MTNNESILQSLLAQQNVVLAKIATCKSAGWDVPDNLTERKAELEADIVRVKADQRLIEDAAKVAQ